MNYTIPGKEDLEDQDQDQNQDILKSRCYAFITDLLLIILINKAIFFILISSVYDYLLIYNINAHITFYTRLSPIYLFSFFTLFWGYFIFCYYLGSGRTFGKILFKLKVKSYNESRENLSFLECLFRTAGYFICYSSGLVLFILPFLTEDQNGIPDWISSTKVIYNTKEITEKKQPIEQLELFAKIKKAA